MLPLRARQTHRWRLGEGAAARQPLIHGHMPPLLPATNILSASSGALAVAVAPVSLQAQPLLCRLATLLGQPASEATFAIDKPTLPATFQRVA